MAALMAAAGCAFGYFIFNGGVQVGDDGSLRVQTKGGCLPAWMREAAANLATRAARFNTKSRILIAMFQVLTQFAAVFTVTYPKGYTNILSSLAVINLDVVSMAPVECVTTYNFYSGLLSDTLLPMNVIAVLLIGRKIASKMGKPGIGGRCVIAAFYVVRPPISALTHSFTSVVGHLGLCVVCRAHGRKARAF